MVRETLPAGRRRNALSAAILGEIAMADARPRAPVASFVAVSTSLGSRSVLGRYRIETPTNTEGLVNNLRSVGRFSPFTLRAVGAAASRRSQ